MEEEEEGMASVKEEEEGMASVMEEVGLEMVIAWSVIGTLLVEEIVMQLDRMGLCLRASNGNQIGVLRF